VQPADTSTTAIATARTYFNDAPLPSQPSWPPPSSVSTVPVRVGPPS
jgi:hypothetical protein